MISTSGQLIEFYIAKFILTILMKQNLSQTIIERAPDPFYKRCRGLTS
jgi:hypothetical protein